MSIQDVGSNRRLVSAVSIARPFSAASEADHKMFAAQATLKEQKGFKETRQIRSRKRIMKSHQSANLECHRAEQKTTLGPIRLGWVLSFVDLDAS